MAVTETVDFDALEVATQENIGQLREARQRLALDALGDEDAREELGNVERELADAEAELGRIALARVEDDRRAAAGRQVELDERRQRAFNRAREIQVRRQAAALGVDSAAAAFAHAIGEYASAVREQQAALTEAGRSPSSARLLPMLVEAAFALELGRAGVGGAIFDRLPVIQPRHLRPLAESDPRPVEPAEAK